MFSAHGVWRSRALRSVRCTGNWLIPAPSLFSMPNRRMLDCV